MAILILTGWSLVNTDTVEKWYNGSYHNMNQPRPISQDDIKEGIQDSKSLISDITNGLTYIGPDSHIWDKVTGTQGLEILSSLNLSGRIVSSYSMSRVGSNGPGVWLKIGEVPSPNAPITLSEDITTMRVSIANGRWMFTSTDPLDTGTIEIYTKQDWQSYTLIHSIVMSNQRVYTENFIPMSLPVGTEICAKISAGKFDDVTLTVEVR